MLTGNYLLSKTEAWKIFRLAALLAISVQMYRAKHWHEIGGHPNDVAVCTYLADSIRLAISEERL